MILIEGLEYFQRRMLAKQKTNDKIKQKINKKKKKKRKILIASCINIDKTPTAATPRHYLNKPAKLVSSPSLYYVIHRSLTFVHAIL